MQQKKGLTLFALTMIAIGATIGSGIFKVPSSIASQVSDNGTILMLWVLGGVVSLCGALVFAELGSRFPKAGGVYSYLNKSFGPLAGFLYGWCLLTVISSGTIAALSTVFAENITFLFHINDENIPYIAVAAILVLTLFNTFSLKASEWFANIGTILKIIGIYSLLFIALLFGEKSILDTVQIQGAGGEHVDNIAAGFVGVLWSYTGWHYASFVSGDAINPKRNIPWAMVLGTGAVTLTYVLCNMGYMSVLSHDEIENSGVVAADAMARIQWISGADIAISTLIALSVFACAGLYILSTPRIINQMATEGVFFSAFAKKHHRFGVPVNAIVLQACWAMCLVMLWGKFSSIIEFVTFIEWLFLLLASIGLFMVRYPQLKIKRTSDSNTLDREIELNKEEKPNFKVPLFPITPLLFIAIVGWFIVMNVQEGKAEYFAGLLVIPVGLIVYALFRSKK
jgi:APA family basic amino acid/polyamine antiporter